MIFWHKNLNTSFYLSLIPVVIGALVIILGGEKAASLGWTALIMGSVAAAFVVAAHFIILNPQIRDTFDNPLLKYNDENGKQLVIGKQGICYKRDFTAFGKEVKNPKLTPKVRIDENTLIVDHQSSILGIPSTRNSIENFFPVPETVKEDMLEVLKKLHTENRIILYIKSEENS